MNACRRLLGLSTVVFLMAAASSGCGSTGNGSAADSGANAVNDSGADQGVEASPSGCFALDANVAALPLPDGGDGGGVTACAACVQSHCSMQISACLNDCTCAAASQCLVSSDAGALMGCLSSNPRLSGIVFCIFLSCSGQCASLLPGDGGSFEGSTSEGGDSAADGGTETGPNASSDASADGGTDAGAGGDASDGGGDGGADVAGD
jgi:hypothetical protein